MGNSNDSFYIIILNDVLVIVLWVNQRCELQKKSPLLNVHVIHFTIHIVVSSPSRTFSTLPNLYSIQQIDQ